MTRTKKTRRLTADRFAVLNVFIDFTLRDLTRPDATVWLVLYRDARDGIARTGQADIAKRAGISDRTVRRSIKRLSDQGLLTVVRRGGIGMGPSSYRLFPVAKDRLDELF